ncbi:MAG TPA: hypothetical protein VFJ82_10250 [Longimicrobium sp.]|nr:hypothetical protein [Longimicrobium sp.]
MTYFDDDYPTSGVLTSSGDTCPNFVVPSSIADPFWSGADEQRVQNPDSVAAADSLTKGDLSYSAPLAVLDPSTGAELEAGNCEVLYNRCVAGCRRLGTRRARAVCYAGCMARYAQCLADEAARKYFPPPTQCPAYDAQLIYDPGDPAYSSGSCGGSSGGGGTGGGGGGGSGSCVTDWVTIEINDGNGWRTYWQGYAIVCG